jgi:phosphate transport system substrate-binding protein
MFGSWKWQVLVLVVVGVIGTTEAWAAENPAADASAAVYSPTSGISGNLNSVGSDTLNNLMTFWAEGFKKFYPNVNIQVEGKGSATAPPALAKGTAQLGPMSRAMKPEEEEAVEKEQGVKPLQISVALDCLAVFVNKDNPVKGLTFAQLDCIFSKTRKSGYKQITKWGDVGMVADEWRDKPISIYGRNSESGTYTYFKEHVLQKGDFLETVKEQPGSAGVISAVAGDKAGIGYSGIGYATSEVRAVQLTKKAAEPLAKPTFENALNGSYPLGRTLYVYVVKKPGKPLPPLVKEFVKYVLSKEGQEIVVKDGFGQLPGTVLAEQLKKIED